jgi:hypothetical protein
MPIKSRNTNGDSELAWLKIDQPADHLSKYARHQYRLPPYARDKVIPDFNMPGPLMQYRILD